MGVLRLCVGIDAPLSGLFFERKVRQAEASSRRLSDPGGGGLRSPGAASRPEARLLSRRFPSAASFLRAAKRLTQEAFGRGKGGCWELLCPCYSWAKWAAEAALSPAPAAAAVQGSVGAPVCGGGVRPRGQSADVATAHLRTGPGDEGAGSGGAGGVSGRGRGRVPRRPAPASF